ncbi:helix-turn-helix transcriptional regulator [Paenibacillus protaetiae]|nr:WYL domain-containing protein [Paenibacillus protaetiae]
MRADRLISIVMLLQTDGKMTASELAKRLEVSERTIYRDMDALSLAGIPVYADAGVHGGFALPDHYKSPFHALTTDEIQSLFVHATGSVYEQLGIGGAFRSALQKLMLALPEQERKAAAWLQERIHLDTDSWREGDKEAPNLKLAQQAIWEQRAVTMAYTSRSGVGGTFELKPYGLVAKGGIWFLIGETEEKVQAFRLSRIEELELSGTYFDRPERFDLQAFWKQWVERFELR